MKRLGQLERHEQLRFADSPSARENRRSSNMNLGFGKSGTRSSTAEVIESDPPSEKIISCWKLGTAGKAFTYCRLSTGSL